MIEASANEGSVRRVMLASGLHAMGGRDLLPVQSYDATALVKHYPGPKVEILIDQARRAGGRGEMRGWVVREGARGKSGASCCLQILTRGQ